MGPGMRRLALSAAASLAATAFAPGGALAQAAATAPSSDNEPISTPRRLMPNFDILNLVPVLDELGVRHELRQTDDGRPYLTAAIGDSFAFNVAPTACLSSDFSRCIGVNIVAFFDAPEANAQTISAFNQKNEFASVGLIGGGEGVFLLRYDIADYGIPRGNLASSLARFVAVAAQLEAELATGPKTVSAEGYASDLAARALNAGILQSLNGAAPRPANPHDASLADAALLAEELLRDGAPANSIGRPQAN